MIIHTTHFPPTTTMPNTNTTTIDLVFRIMRADGGRTTIADARRLGSFLDDDGDALSLEGGRFILADVRGDDPQVFCGRLSVSFEVDVEAYDGDDTTPEGLLAEVYDAAILLLPDEYEVADLAATLA